MAPLDVRAVPPWVVQPPRRSHNTTLNGSHHNRNISSASYEEPDYDSDSEKYISSGTGPTGGLGAIDGASDTRPAAGTPISGTTAAATTTGGSNGAAQEAQEISGGGGGRKRRRSLFRRREGRKWDHLRSAEPVIVPQFHVVNGRAAAARGDDVLDIQKSGPRSGRPTTDLESGVGGASAAPASEGAEKNSTASRSAYSNPATQTPASERHQWWYNPGTQWRDFIDSTRYPDTLAGRRSRVLTESEMDEMFPRRNHYSSSMQPRVGSGDGGGGVGHFHKQHRLPYYGSMYNSSSSGSGGGACDNKYVFLYQRIWRALLHHPLGPLACRLMVLSTSIVALAVAATIFRREKLGSVPSSLADGTTSLSKIAAVERLQERTQIIVAIVVDIVAVPYIGYITFDDYTGKPLGLRPPQDRIRLILLDMFFIILKSASTALGFEAMIYFVSNGNDGLLRALGVFELIGLIAWSMTLTINIFREIERLGGR